MKKTIKHIINYSLFILALVAMVSFGCGCTTTKPDPLAGWHAASKEPTELIGIDCQNYINTLSPKEKKYLGPSPTSFFEDGTGKHAVKIQIGIDGTVWEHVLIYDKDDKRIKTIKYASGHYGN